MIRNTLILMLASLIVPLGAEAKICDLSGSTAEGNAQAVVSLRVDTVQGEVDYDIITNGLGTLTTAEILRLGDSFLPLPLVSLAGSAFGSVVAPGTEFTDLVDNPQEFSLSLSGDGSTQVLSIPLQLAGDCIEAVVPVDLKLKKVKVTSTGRLLAKVSNLSADPSLFTAVRFFASRNRQLTEDDTLIGIANLRVIEAGKKKKAKVRMDLPDGLTGQFFVIGFADPADRNNDPNRANNEKATKSRVALP